jgi:8-oxo-dGTP pyrophosphatase MutT (NUDIX family)
MKKVVVSTLMYQDGCLLMARRQGDRLWTTPGGKVEVNETLEEAVKRETLEEVGVDLTRLVLTGFIDLPTKIIFLFFATEWCGPIKNVEPEKHTDWEWVAHIPDDSVPGLVAFREGNFVRTGKRP